MASARPLTTFARIRPFPPSSILRNPPCRRTPATTAFFSNGPIRPATSHGPPPQGFRLQTPKRWDEGSESSLDKAGRYFLLTEMLRGMYVVLEQFFRPPYVALSSYLPRQAAVVHASMILVPPCLSLERYLIYTQLHNLLSVRKRPYLPTLPWRACSAPLPYRRRTLHCVQAL